MFCDSGPWGVIGDFHCSDHSPDSSGVSRSFDELDRGQGDWTDMEPRPTERKLGLAESCWRQHFLAGDSVDYEISVFMEHFAKRFQAVISFSHEDTSLLPELFQPVGSQISGKLRLNSILFRKSVQPAGLALWLSVDL